MAPANTLRRSNFFWCFGAVFAVAFAVRLLIVLLSATEPRNDLLWNDAVGWNLANGNGFTASRNEPRVPGIYRTPAYPAFLALVYSFFGHSHRAVYVAQIILDSVVAVLIGIITLRFAAATTALVASALYALYPYPAFFCGVLHQDILLAFATVIVLFGVVEASRTGGSAARWAAVGVATGLTALVKANFILFAIVPALAIWLGAPRPRRRAIATIALMLGTTAAIAPWVVRNYVIFRAFPPLAAGATGTNLMYLLDELDGGEQRIFAKFKRHETDSARYLETFLDGHALISAERELAKAAGAELLRRWPEYSLVVGYHFPRLWVTRRSIGNSPMLGVIAFVLSWPVLAFGLAGMWFARRDWPQNLPLYLTVLTITAMYAPYTPEARYTLPARPAMLVFVAYALVAAVDLSRTRRKRWDPTAGERVTAVPDR